MNVNVYVDGFNLYYGCLQNSPYKWLNLLQMCQLLLPKSTINQLKYFTAKVSARPNDPSQPVRQATYMRALETLPNCQVIYGHFLSNRVRMTNANPPPNTVEVIKTEEKGSDVNLATHLLYDAFSNQFDTAVIVTNDSDLYLPMEFVVQKLNLPVGILNPHKHPSKKLLTIAKFIKPIREGVLKASQFPSSLTDANGTFSKPVGW